jgi:hypothetical protein
MSHRIDTWGAVVSCAALAGAMLACGGAATSGVAVGKIGRDLSAHADTVPQGAEVCALQAAAATPSNSDKSTSETCSKALKSDQLWRRAMRVLASYGETLESLSSGADKDKAGQLEAAETGITGPNWIDAEGPDVAARDAVTQLVTQMNAAGGKGDLNKVVKDAAPSVKTVCDGLGAYLEAQRQALVDVQQDLEKKRGTQADYRCGSMNGSSVCVNTSMVDRVSYANAFGQAAVLEASHREARDAVLGFCAAHAKLADAAANGDASKDATFTAVVSAVSDVRKSSGASAPAPSAAPK